MVIQMILLILALMIPKTGHLLTLTKSRRRST
jgi:hypothetical protein